MKKLFLAILLVPSLLGAGTITTSYSPLVASFTSPTNKCTAGGFTGTATQGCSLTATTVGNLIVVELFIQSSTITINSITDGGANTWHIIGPSLGTGNETFLGWTVVTTSFGSFQWNMSSATNGDASGAEYTGMAPSATVLDCNSSGSTGNSVNLVSGTCTPSAANDLIVAVGGVMQNTANMTAGGGLTLEDNQAHSTQGNSYGYEDGNSFTVCASTQATMTSSISGQWSMLMAAFKTSNPTSCTATGNGSVTFH